MQEMILFCFLYSQNQAHTVFSVNILKWVNEMKWQERTQSDVAGFYKNNDPFH